MLCAERVQVVEVSGMCQGCVKDVSGLRQWWWEECRTKIYAKSNMLSLAHTCSTEVSARYIHVMHVSGMCQGCVRDVSGTSYGIEYVIIGIYMQYGSVSEMHVMHVSGIFHGCVRDVSGTSYGCTVACMRGLI